MVRNKIFEASLFPFDAVSLSYFVRSTCLLRTFNVLTSYEVRQKHQVFWENSSDFLAKTCGGTCLLMWGNTSFDLMSFLFCLMNLSYFGRSTCLLRSINVLTSAEVRQRHQVFLEKTSDFLAKIT